MNQRATVLLYELNSLALIVPASTQIVYRNQTGGHACLPSQMEGYLVPFAGELSGKCERLRSHFTGPKWGGWCAQFIDAETANTVDSILADVPGRDQVRVDRSKLNVSREAWVHVKTQGRLLGLLEHDVAAVLEWFGEHQDELRENWERARREEPLEKTEPLE